MGLGGLSLLEEDENTNKSFDEVAPGEHPSWLRQLDGEGPRQLGDQRERLGSGSKIQINKVNEMDIKVSRFDNKATAKVRDLDGKYAIEELIPNEEPLIQIR